jgi:hypothetical protein
MELVDRYLYAVRNGLPKGQQDDIIAELGEDLRSEIGDLETGLGRPVNEAEVVEILKQRGHPAAVAGRYLPQQYLIGPALFPVYMLVVRIVTAVLVPVFALIVGPIAVATAPQPSHAVVQSLWDLAMAVVFSVGVITVVFAILERHPVNVKPFEKWDPRQLPRVPKSPPDSRSTPRATAVAELAASFITATLYVAWFRTMFDVGGVHITLNPIWRSLYWPFLAVILGGSVKGWVSLMWPERLRLRFGIRVVLNAITVILAAILLNTGVWVDIAATGVSAAGIADAVRWTNFGVKIFLVLTVVMAIGDAIPEGLRLFRKKTSWNYSIAT